MSEQSESDTVRDPRFLCHCCGFLNVQLTDSGAICTQCGTRYSRPAADLEGLSDD